MKELTPFSIVKLSNLELIQFVEQLEESLAAKTQASYTDEDFNQCRAELLRRKTIYKTSQMAITKSEQTALLLKWDIARDGTLFAIESNLKAASKSIIPAELEAHDRLQIVVQKYKGLAYKNYEAETAGIDTYLEKISDPKLLADAEMLGMMKNFSQLQVTNIEFKKAYASRYQEGDVQVLFEDKVSRKILQDQVGLTADYVRVMANVRKTAFYDELLQIFNNARTTYNTINNQRQGRKVAAKTKAEQAVVEVQDELN